MTTTESVTDRIRSACRAVARKAVFITIDHERIPSYAASLPLEQVARPSLDPSCHYLGRGDATVAFFLTLNTVNFGSGYSPCLRKRPGMSGYYTVASSLNDHFRANRPFTAHELGEIAQEDCTRIFGQEPDNHPVSELMGHFAVALNDLGRFLLDRFDGSFRAPVEAAGASAERLVGLLAEMPYFRDEESYADGLQVPFYKRAQITAADLHLAFDGRGPGRFDDLDRLTMFADNLVPHVLRVDGILRYAESLAARIDAERLIPAGSAEEVEIRACAVHAVELLVEELRRTGQDVRASRLDFLLWNRGQQPFYKARPRHRTRTVFY